MKTLRRELAERFDAFTGVDAYSDQAERTEEVDSAVRAVQSWLAAMAQDRTNDYDFLIREADH